MPCASQIAANAKGKPSKSKVAYGADWYKQTKNVMPGRRDTVKEQIGAQLPPHRAGLMVVWHVLH
jgi:hypothetical protein